MTGIVHNYLDQVQGICSEILGDNFIALYAQGSLALQDWRRGISDFDLVGVVESELKPGQPEKLAEVLDHNRTPVPANGTELLIVTRETAQKLVPVPAYEMWMYTGEEWPNELEIRQTDSELHIFFSILRQCGKDVLGPPAREMFAQPPREWVLQAMREVLQFHLDKLLDDWWDPNGRNSVLNACRTWRYAKVGNFVSKTEGGEWVLQQEKIPAVELALRNKPVSHEEARAFVERVIGELS